MVKHLLITLMLLCSFAAQAKVTASVDKNPVLIGETFTLSIRSEDGGGEPDLSELENTFQVLGNSSSSQFQIINGRAQRSHDWLIQLRSTQLGKHLIPAITVGKERTQPIEIEVRKPQTQAGQLPEAFIEFSLDKNSAYVREQVLVVSRLFIRGNLVSGSFSEPQSEHIVLEQIGEQTESQTLKGQHRYRVIERRYALYPEQSGDLTINPPIFNGEVATGQQRRSLFGFSGGTRAIYAAGDPHTLSVKPQAASFSGADWLPASGLEMHDEISPAQGPWQVGEPLTRIITITVDGQLHTHLPKLDIPLPASSQSYTEAPQGKTLSHAGGLLAEQTYSVAIIPAADGRLHLPELRIRWWDTERDAARTSVLPARDIEIAAKPAAIAAPPPMQSSASELSQLPAPSAVQPEAGLTTPTSPVWPWQVATAAAVAGWLGTLLAWWLQTRPAPASNTPNQTESASRRRVIKALQQSPAIECQRLLLNWAREEIGPMAGLLSLRQYTEDEETQAALLDLDSAAFGGSQNFAREPLIRLVKTWRAPKTHNADTALPPLYPGSS